MQTLKILKSQHPHQQQTPELLSAWHIGLDRLSDREIEGTLKRYLETPRKTDFFPPVALLWQLLAQRRHSVYRELSRG